MGKSNVEKATWILDRIDGTGFLGREIMNGKVYVSDATTGRRYLYNPDSSDHQDLKTSVDHIHNMAKNIDDTLVYHITISNFHMGGNECYMINYLYISASDDYYEYSLKSHGMVMCYVHNLTWDIQEHGSIGVKMRGDLILRVS